MTDHATTTQMGRVVVLGGKTGMLGQALMTELKKCGVEAIPQGRDDVDVTDAQALGAYLEKLAPACVFNAIAYTKVDLAEEERDAAMQLNAALPDHLGQLAVAMGFRLVHYSTDFVFNGKKQAPYAEDDETDPQSVYGASKLAGEQALRAHDPAGLLILRTAWLFGPGRGNFVRTMLNLCKDRDNLTVVHDQIGSPTYTRDLARYSLDLVAANASGLFHLVNSGQASWCELASEACSLAGLPCVVQAITSAEYPQKATRPAYSVLSTEAFTRATGVTPRPWAKALREYVFKDLDVTQEAS